MTTVRVLMSMIFLEGNLVEMSCKFELEKSVGCERKNGGSLSPEITGAENWLTGADICIRETNCFSLSLSPSLG